MDKILNLSLSEIASMLRGGKVSSRQVTLACLEQIKNTKNINAILDYDEKEALLQADEADKKLKIGEKGSLLGVPIVVKDNICTKEYKTTCASKFLENFRPVYDATVISKLKKEGAVILAKANMDEFAMGGTGETSAFGKTLNPLDYSRVTGGSSSGSAASVASKQCFASLGSDTGGSIRQPAAFCGLVGLKPTYGRVSRYGVVAFGSSLDQVGPIARSVGDCAIVFDAIAGYDEMDGTSQNIDKKIKFADISPKIKGLRIGFAEQIFKLPIDEAIKNRIAEVIEFFKKNGAEIVKVSLPNVDKALADYYILSSAEAASNLARFDGIKYGVRARNCDGITDVYYKSRTEGFGKEVKRRILIGNFVLSSGYYDAYYKKGLEVQDLLKTEFASAFEKCDVIISPTTPSVAFKFGSHSSLLETYMSDILTVPASMVLHPAITFPVGNHPTEGMPIGCQLIGKMWGEADLFALASFYEKNKESK